jgi:hypothetical protein
MLDFYDIISKGIILGFYRNGLFTWRRLENEVALCFFTSRH